MVESAGAARGHRRTVRSPLGAPELLQVALRAVCRNSSFCTDHG